MDAQAIQNVTVPNEHKVAIWMEIFQNRGRNSPLWGNRSV